MGDPSSTRECGLCMEKEEKRRTTKPKGVIQGEGEDSMMDFIDYSVLLHIRSHY